MNIVVDGYSERWVRKGFPWVYPKEVTRGKPKSGQEVLVRAANGECLGRGLADEGWLAVRLFRHDEGPLDAEWLGATLAKAWAWRRRALGAESTGYRLVNAENDGLPGIRIDCWGDHAVIVLDSPAVHPLVDGVVEWLSGELKIQTVHLCYRADPRDTLDLSRVSPKPGRILGESDPGEVEVLERGLRFAVRPGDGPDVGLYADMRETRAWMEPHWPGRTVLNTFAYTGAFSVSAAHFGASEVVTVDLSERILERARNNFAINRLPLDNHEFSAEDTFKALDRFRRKGRRFDAIVLDPPSFSHGPAGTWSAVKDYSRLVAASARVLVPEGLMITACNLGELSPHKFQGEVEEGFRRAERVAQEVWRGSQSLDFPAASWFPEGRYLKVSVWRIG